MCIILIYILIYILNILIYILIHYSTQVPTQATTIPPTAVPAQAPRLPQVCGPRLPHLSLLPYLLMHLAFRRVQPRATIRYAFCRTLLASAKPGHNTYAYLYVLIPRRFT